MTAIDWTALVAIIAILALLIIAPSSAGVLRSTRRLVQRGSDWLCLELDARADGCDARDAAYRRTKGRVA